MTRKSLVATVVGIAAVAAPSAFADKGGIPHQGSNGQGSAAAQQQTAATAPHGKALAKGHAKTHGKSRQAKGHTQTHANAHATQPKTHPSGRALAKGHAKQSPTATPKTTGTPSTNTHAKAGKTTICHATGSATNPYVTITISNNAIPAHRRHQDGRDIIPAPAGGCPTQSEESQPQPGTPSEQLSSPEQPAAPSRNPAAATGAQPTGTEQGGVLGTSVSGSSTSPTSGASTGTSPAKSGVLGASTSSGSPSASAAPAATATRAASSSRLPFTGTDVIIVAILGLAALLLGVTARRIATSKS